MDNKIKKQIKKWTHFFIESLESTGLQKQEIAESLAIGPKTISNWLNVGDKGTIPRKNVFVRLAISCIRAKGLNLPNGETIGGSAIAGALLGARFGILGGPIGAGIAAVIGAAVAEWLKGNIDESKLIEKLQELDRNQSDWQEILKLLENSKELFSSEG